MEGLSGINDWREVCCFTGRFNLDIVMLILIPKQLLNKNIKLIKKLTMRQE